MNYDKIFEQLDKAVDSLPEPAYLMFIYNGEVYTTCNEPMELKEDRRGEFIGGSVALQALLDVEFSHEDQTPDSQ